MNFTFLKYPQRFPSTSQTHDLIVVIQTETFQRHRLSANKQAMRKKKTQKDKEKREKTHQLSIWRMTSFVPSLSFLSHLLGWTESPLSLSGMTASLKSLETPFSSVSLASPLSLPHSGCYFPETLWISYNPFFFPHLLSYFLISAWTRIQHLPLDKLSVSLSICLSTSLFSQCLSGPKAPWEKYKMKLKKKKKII